MLATLLKREGGPDALVSVPALALAVVDGRHIHHLQSQDVHGSSFID
jgi:hypothetical protein